MLSRVLLGRKSPAWYIGCMMTGMVRWAAAAGEWRGIGSCRQIDNVMWWREAYISVSAVKPRYIGCTNFSPTSLVEWLSSAETNARYTLLTVEATRAVRPGRSTTQEVVDDGRPDCVACPDGRQWNWGCFWSAGCCVTIWKKGGVIRTVFVSAELWCNRVLTWVVSHSKASLHPGVARIFLVVALKTH